MSERTASHVKGGKRISKILAPLDLRATGTQSLKHAAKVAKSNNASLTILNVIDLDLHTPECGPANWDCITQDLLQNAQNQFEVVTRRFGNELELNLAIEEGFAFEVVPAYVMKNGIDLVVLEQKGHPWWIVFRRRTVQRVSQSCPCPVFVVMPCPHVSLNSFQAPSKLISAYCRLRAFPCSRKQHLLSTC